MTDIRQLAVATDTELTALFKQAWATKEEITVAEATLRALRATTLRAPADMDRYITEQQAKLNTLYDELALREAAIAELEQVWEQYRWARFFLVLNTNGHIHKTMRCQTCYDNTRFTWLPELAALTEAEAVAQEGEILCTVCFPTAPVEWTMGVGTRTEQARDAKRAAKDARLAAKQAKWLTDNAKGLTVTTLGGYTERLTTLTAARQWLTAAVLETLPAPWKTQNAEVERRATWEPEDVAKVAAAVAAKEQKTADAVLAEATERANKKMRAEIRAYERRTVLT